MFDIVPIFINNAIIGANSFNVYCDADLVNI